MMGSPLELLAASVAVFMFGAFGALAFAWHEAVAIRIAGLAGILGGILGVLAALPVLTGGGVQSFMSAGPFPFAAFTVRLDPLAALMVCVISAMAAITALYSLAYVREYAGRGAWAMCFFMNTFVASMLALVVVDNALYFLIFFEMMSLASYFLVIFDQDREAVRAGFLYFLIAHAGSVLIMAAFFILYSRSGSLDFASFRGLGLSAPLASTVFLLAFLGFGAKAGMVPLHGWLPRAHPAAPSHASAMMSGVMVKIGVFGIIRVGVDLLGAQQQWWGLLVLAVGAISAVLGVLYALAEHDVKRLLAYSTVENVGIILMGTGVGMAGIAGHQPVLATVGLLAAVYHLVNHASFKGLLFLGAGSILYRTHTRNMEELGGLARRMPVTSAIFLVGAMAISALPPLNGFVSEWFTYQSLFSLGREADIALRLAGPIGIAMLALTGALAAMCFVKAYGLCFSGLPRSEHAEHATEVPGPMQAAMLLLAALIVFLGVGASLVSPVMANVATSLSQLPQVQLTSTAALGTAVVPGDVTQALLSTPLLTILLIAIPVLPLLLVSAFAGARLPRRHGGDSWACGYAQEQVMTISAHNFAQPLRQLFLPLYRLREQLSPAGASQHVLERTMNAAGRIEPLWDRHVIERIVRCIDGMGGLARRLQHGDFRIYCLYVVATLVILLLVAI